MVFGSPDESGLPHSEGGFPQAGKEIAVNREERWARAKENALAPNPSFA
jgi:hypothetical protein